VVLELSIGDASSKAIQGYLCDRSVVSRCNSTCNLVTPHVQELDYLFPSLEDPSPAKHTPLPIKPTSELCFGFDNLAL
jgi:hypothetical protein